MAFLQNSNVFYYFPFASGTQGMREEIKGVTWSDGGGWAKQSPSGFLGSGAYSAAPGTNRLESTGTRSPTYSGSTGTTSLTFALWASGVGANAKFYAGWEHFSNGNYHAVQLGTDGSNRLSMSYWLNDPGSSPLPFAGATGPICNNNGWTLLTTRIETVNAESMWWISGSVSVNGGPWQQLGRRSLGAATWESIADGKTLIGWADRVGSETDQRSVDEFIVWQNAPRFSTQELQNLYDLGATYRRPMPEYSTQYAAAIKVSGYTTGCASGLGWVETRASGSSIGHLVESGVANGYASGVGLQTGTAAAYLTNKWAFGETDARVMSMGQTSGWGTAEIHTQNTVSAQTPAFVRGTLVHQRLLFLKTIPPEVSGSTQGIIYGSQTGGTLFRIAHANALLYYGDEPKPMTRRSRLFLKAAPAPGVTPINRQVALFLPGGNVAKASLPAIVSAIEPIYEAAGAFIYGDGDPLSANYTPIRGSYTWFCKAVPGAYAVLGVSLAGDLLFPSGSCDAFLMGCSGLTTASGYAFAAGYNSSEESADAVLVGIYGIATGDMGLYVNGVCTPVSGCVPAYSHGY